MGRIKREDFIADILGTKRPAVTIHLGNIFSCEESDRSSDSSILEYLIPLQENLEEGRTDCAL